VKSLAYQSTEEMGGPLSVLTRQKQDHLRMERLLRRLPHVSGTAEQDVLNRICRLVFSHAFAEEAVLWPALRRALPDGEALTARVEAEHQEITELVADLEASDADDPGRGELIERTVALLRQDARDEEDELLPRLQDALDVNALRRLGVAWEIVRRTAPTRAHPIVARRPPGNTLAALPLSVIDRARDVIDATGRRVAPARSVLGTASERLAGGARYVERMPVMRRGEPRETQVRMPRQRS
jgi:hypothetical protein